MTTNDNRAALDAAIDAAIHSIRTTDSMLSARTAIAILVADEVSLRLAAAPTVDDAIAALERDAFAHGKVPGTPAGLDLAVAREQDRNALRTAIAAEVARALAAAPEVEEAIEAMAEDIAASDEHVPIFGADGIGRDRLRAAIAADRARAVAEATDGAVRAERFADTVCSLVGARDHGRGGQTVDAGTARMYADAVVRIGAIIARDKTRPTPDEARRLVGDLVRALTGGVVRFPPSYGKTTAAKTIDDASAALLRALGVEP